MASVLVGKSRTVGHCFVRGGDGCLHSFAIGLGSPSTNPWPKTEASKEKSYSKIGALRCHDSCHK